MSFWSRSQNLIEEKLKTPYLCITKKTAFERDVRIQTQPHRGSRPAQEAAGCQVVKPAIIWEDLVFKFDHALYAASSFVAVWFRGNCLDVLALALVREVSRPLPAPFLQLTIRNLGRRANIKHSHTLSSCCNTTLYPHLHHSADPGLLQTHWVSSVLFIT